MFISVETCVVRAVPSHQSSVTYGPLTDSSQACFFEVVVTKYTDCCASVRASRRHEAWFGGDGGGVPGCDGHRAYGGAVDEGQVRGKAPAQE